MERKKFFDTYAFYAMAEQMRCGIPASITLAQMYLESGGGSSYLAREGNNFFGIKKGSGWNGDVLYANDDKKHEAFRKYDNVHDSIRNHSVLLMGSRYQKQCGNLSETDYKGWAYGIKAAGYATDPKYSEKLIDFIEINHLDEYDKFCAGGEPKSQHLANDVAKQENSFGMPLRNSDTIVLTSDFGLRNIKNGTRNHEGIDLRAAKGTDVYASENGIVLTAGYQGQDDEKARGGNYLYVAYPRTDGTYRVASYLHLDSISVKAGDQVTADTILGKSGNTGGVDAHLHFGVAKVDQEADKKALDDYIAKLQKGEKVEWSTIRDAVKGNNVSHFYDAKEYLAEVAMAGNLDVKITKKNDKKNEDLLATAKSKVSQEDVALLSQKGASGEIDHFNVDSAMASFTSLFREGLVGANGQNAMMNLLQQSGMGAGGGLISSLVSMAFMLFMSTFAGKNKSERQAVAQDITKMVKGEEDLEKSMLVDPDAVRKASKEKPVQGFDAAALREKNSMLYTIRSAEEAAQQQQDRSQGMGLLPS